MLDYKSFPNVFKSCLNNIHSWFYINWSFSKQPKCQQSFWATFESEFVAKSFQKSPNLVTLDGTLYSLTAWSSTTKNGLAYLVELVQRLLVLGGVSPPLPWQVDVDLGFDECQAVRDKANVSRPSCMITAARSALFEGSVAISIRSKATESHSGLVRVNFRFASWWKIIQIVSCPLKEESWSREYSLTLYGKYHFMADLLFYGFWFNQSGKPVDNMLLFVCSEVIDTSHAVILPLG